MSKSDFQLHACLIETEQILDDLMTLNYEIEKATYDMATSPDETKYKIADRKKDMFLDQTIIKLYTLFEVHSTLGKCIVDLGKQQMLTSLKPHWKKISKHEKMITLWRDQIVAHSEDRAKDFKLFTEIDPSYFENIPIILSVSRFAVIYLWALRVNLLQEFKDAWKRKDEKMEGMKWLNIEDLLTNLIHEEKNFFKEINKTLKENNLTETIFCGYDEWPMNKVN